MISGVRHHDKVDHPVRFGGFLVPLLATLLLLVTGDPARAADAAPHYASPDLAVDALIQAMRGGNDELVSAVLGPKSSDLINSGDPVADRDANDRFVAAYAEKNTIIFEGRRKALLMLGASGWPFPIPLVKSDLGWGFDAAAGRNEILNRRIGRNELNAIEVCRTYVEAQNTYVNSVGVNDAQGRESGGSDNAFPAYAQRILSTPGTHDGLYWPAGADEAPSPLGPLMASARADGYEVDRANDADRKPYHGYLFRVLKAQGAAAPGGAHDYVVDGQMIGGFALVAFPARWGDSGIMTFIVSHDGVVYQRNLGPDTFSIANKITTFNPDKGWGKP